MKHRTLGFFGGVCIVILLSISLKMLAELPARVQSTSLLIAAPASLQDALEDIDPLLRSTNPGLAANYNFAASGSLQQQIEQGALVDVFISAAAKQMDALQAKNLIVPTTRRNLLRNHLALVVPVDSRLGLTDFRQLTLSSVRRISIGEPRSVPVGQYAIEVFRNLGIAEQIRPKLVYGNSVRNVLATVESGNSDAGIVYVTDARISDRVKQVAIAPANLHTPIFYPIAVIRTSRKQRAARAYGEFLHSRLAQSIFRNHGFSTTP